MEQFQCIIEYIPGLQSAFREKIVPILDKKNGNDDNNPFKGNALNPSECELDSILSGMSHEGPV